MKKIFLFLFIALQIPNIAVSGIAGVGDTRRVIGWIQNYKPWYCDEQSEISCENIWNTHPYWNYVMVISGESAGTGELISPIHILTNEHVADNCGTDGVEDCFVFFSDGYASAKKVAGGGSTESIDKDWAILEITKGDVFLYDGTIIHGRKHYFGYKSPSESQTMVYRAGFGGLKVLTRDDIFNIRKAYNSFLISKSDWLYSIRMKDAVNFSYGDKELSHDTEDFYSVFLTEFKNLTGKDFLDEYMEDGATLKLIDGCDIKTAANNLIFHNCDSWSGDSGSSINDASNKIVGLNRGGYRFVTTNLFADTFINVGPNTNNIFTRDVIDMLNKAKNEYKGENNSNGDDDNNQNGSQNSNQERVIGQECGSVDLPGHAVSGHYINNGTRRLECANGTRCSCAATSCESGYYLVVNDKGWSQGWCFTKQCPSGQHLNIIDGTKTDLTCVDD